MLDSQALIVREDGAAGYSLQVWMLALDVCKKQIEVLNLITV